MSIKSQYEQLSLLPPAELAHRRDGVRDISPNPSNDLLPEDRPFHQWYRFVLSYPPHLVRAYLENFKLGAGCTVLDPFCGTGTTIVEAKKNGITGMGLEANPFPHFASSVKVDWRIEPETLWASAQAVADQVLAMLRSQGIRDHVNSQAANGDLRSLAPRSAKILINDSISPMPLHKTLVLRDSLEGVANQPFYKYGKLALGNALVNTISNLRFGPEVGVGKKKVDVPVIDAWLTEVRKMVNDLRLVTEKTYPSCSIHLADARAARQILAPCSIDAVITSPPYPNEKDYTRTTRLESVLLGFYDNMSELRALKKRLVRSNTRSVYTVDQDDVWVAGHTEIQRIAAEIEERRIALGKTSGFEKLYGRVTKLYFGGMARHLAELRPVLRPGAKLAYVVGDQASYLQVMIRTGTLLADIASRLGYTVERIDLFRTRFATATQMELREEVVVLSWPG
jgi:DNA modification methylase